MSRTAVAVDVALDVNEGADTAAPGGEVTIALCGLRSTARDPEEK